MPAHEHITAILEGHAAALLAEGRVEEALALGDQVLVTARETYAQEPKMAPVLVQALENLAEIKRDADQMPESEALYREALELAIKAPLAPEVVTQIRIALAAQLDMAGKEAESLPEYEKAIQELEEQTPPDDFLAGQLRNNVAMIYKRSNRYALAEQHYLRALEAFEKQDSQSDLTASVMNNLGGLYYTTGFASQAKDIFEEALALRVQLHGADHPDVAQSHSNLATVQHELGDNVAAQRSYESSLRILEAHLPAKAASYQAVGDDYIALLGSIHEERKAAAFQKRMEKALRAAGVEP